MRKVQLTIKQEEVAPATTSDLVVMSHGKTLKEELSTNVLDKFSREVTVVSSMEKVADGVYDEPYESLVFNGRSLVNLVEKPTSANVGNGKKWNGYGGGNPSKTFITNGVRLSNTQYGSIVLDYFDLSLFKPDTKYTLFVDVYHNGEGVPPVLDKIAGTGQHAIQLYNGRNCIVFTTVSDLTSQNMGIRFGYAGSTSESCIYEFSNIIIVEGDHSSINPDYFEGIGDCKMPILRNTGKNFLYKHGDINNTYGISHFHDGGFTTGSMGSYATFGCIRSLNKPSQSYLDKNPTSIQKGKTYTFSCEVKKISGESSKLNYLRFVGYNCSGDSYSWTNIGWNSAELNYDYSSTIKLSKTVVCDKTYKHIVLAGQVSSDSSNAVYEITNIQLEEAPSVTTYENYKSNVLRTPEEIVLREVNGICDTYNALTGEYVKRIGEIILDGSESWAVDKNYEAENHICYKTVIPNINDGDRVFNVLCDKFPTQTGGNLWGKDLLGISGSNVNAGGKGIKLSVRKSDLNSLTTDGLKEFLSQNPTTVQYQLESPIVAKVDLSAVPFAYQSGQIILESGFEGQSLLPELSYSVPASKNGVISTTSKAILKHEQRLHKFEDLLLRESILMDYRLTLSFLDKM